MQIGNGIWLFYSKEDRSVFSQKEWVFKTQIRYAGRALR